tara:strand:- start:216 stop:818 length:603 start_codon:yes stop_codon:yes gene_type:complete
MTFHQIFPDIVYKTKIADSEIIKKKFADKIINKFLHDPNQKADWAGFCHTWQSPANEEIKKLFYTHFEQHVHKWLEYYGFPNIRYKADMWINVHTSDMYQETHYHIGKGCIISGNYNLQLGKKDTPLIFTKKVDYLNMLRGFVPLDNRDTIDLNAVEGDLLLFPPTQMHLVPRAKEQHDGHRITISFNVYTRPFIPNEDA